ncbi:amino acid ABC transporter substrate-binding protein [Aliikangiella marina]|uniref:Amino acid ABC transporter substrate-binding protein n=1 Tax=Aliikangiella marina TaxID=1712262 RepID=A0A545T4K0_9GAMM|nr:transporter substrate-binding domain-containing protein [Aliikangiella marina]TQV72098.1 amino acid ABC transporter substrate-binding protein [Aliikangiella marina]
MWSFIPKILVFSILLLVTSQLSAQIAKQSEPDKGVTDCRLRVAWNPWPPFIESAEEARGIHIDLMNWLGDALKCQIIYKRMNWEQSIIALEKGDIDLLGRASITDARKKFAYFSDPYRESLVVLYVRKGESRKHDAESIEDLLKQDFVIGLQKGAYYGETIMRLKEQPEYFDNFPELVFDEGPPVSLLLNRSIDGLLESPYTIDSILLKKHNRSQIEEFPIQIFSEQLHFMLSKKTLSADFVAQLNQALAEVRQTEAYKQHWFWKAIK